MYWNLYFGPNDIVSLLQAVSGNSRPLTAGMNQEVVIVSEPFNQLTCTGEINHLESRALITDSVLQSKNTCNTPVILQNAVKMITSNINLPNFHSDILLNLSFNLTTIMICQTTAIY